MNTKEMQERIQGMEDDELFELVTLALSEVNIRKISVPGIKLVGGLAAEGANAEVELPSEEASAQTQTFEMIVNQVDNAKSAYSDVCSELGVHFGTTKEDIQTELFDWLTDDKLDYVASALEADPELEFTLVATPNMVISASLLQKLIGNFSQDHNHNFASTLKYFDEQQLCGTDPNNGKKAVFALIPNKLDERLYGSFAKQIAALETLQEIDLATLKVPSVLEAIVYWYTLRNSGKLTNERGTLRQTYVDHFNLVTDRLPEGAKPFVVDSCIDDVGHAWIKETFVDEEASGKVAVG